jgi:phage-related protein
MLIKVLEGVVGAIIALKVITTVVSIVQGFITVIQALSTAFVALDAVLVANPIGLVVVAIVAAIAILAAAVYALVENWDAVKTAFTDAGNAIMSGLESAWSGVTNFFTDTIPQAFNSFIDAASALPGRVGSFFSDLFLNQIPYALGYGLGFMRTATEEGIQATIAFFQQLPDAMIDVFGTVTSAMEQWGSDVIDLSIETGRSFAENIISFFKALPGQISDFTSQVFNAAQQIGSGIFNGIMNFIMSIPQAIEQFLTDMVNAVFSVVRAIKNAISSIFSSGSSGYEQGRDAASAAVSLVIPGFATGVDNFGGGLAVVGENGPELAYLPNHTSIKDAEETKRVLDGAGAPEYIQNHIHIDGREVARSISRPQFGSAQDRFRAAGLVMPK